LAEWNGVAATIPLTSAYACARLRRLCSESTASTASLRRCRGGRPFPATVTTALRRPLCCVSQPVGRSQ
jgi:hypothetical protein